MDRMTRATTMLRAAELLLNTAYLLADRACSLLSWAGGDTGTEVTKAGRDKLAAAAARIDGAELLARNARNVMQDAERATRMARTTHSEAMRGYFEDAAKLAFEHERQDKPGTACTFTFVNEHGNCPSCGASPLRTWHDRKDMVEGVGTAWALAELPRIAYVFQQYGGPQFMGGQVKANVELLMSVGKSMQQELEAAVEVAS